MTPGREQPSNGMIIGVGAILFAAVLIGYGMHHLIATGTCSSTGYAANFGPVPHCPSGTAAWVGFLVGGIFVILIGGFLSGNAVGLILPGIFCAIGAGSISVAFERNASSGASTFGLIFGAFFLVMGAVPAFFVIRSGLRAVGPGSRPAGPAATPSAPVQAPPAEPARGGDAAAAFGGSRDEPDAILGTYRSEHSDPAQ